MAIGEHSQRKTWRNKNIMQKEKHTSFYGYWKKERWGNRKPKKSKIRQ